MDTIETGWARSRIIKLERRLRHQRDAGRELPLDSIIRAMNDRAVIEMEVKLFGLKKQIGAGLLDETARRPA